MSAAVSTPAVELVVVPGRRVAVVRGRVAPTGMREAQQVARAALASLGADGRRLTLWRQDDGLFDYAPGVEVADEIAPTSPVSVVELPPGRAAHLAFRGGYERLGEAWGQLFAGCQALGVATVGWNLEVYAAAGEPDGADLYAMVT